jgi:hypothetical protein
VGVKNPRKMEEKPPQFSTFFVVNFLFLVIEAAIEYIEMEIFYLLIFMNLAHQLIFYDHLFIGLHIFGLFSPQIHGG